ncbi:Pycsar system effector family protein [Pseudomonas paraeruginosa]|uniref:Pycsar system effector family protein n=1 Tax=Pseudomonas paraeruginosa TaxID=2994495 RepID=UPI0039FC77A3|nr:DUF5706 domain-containing protein [Pseudomonas aeruginosa]HCF2415316.1 hypothetical protein [Pseudomonas aeruginosa]
MSDDKLKASFVDEDGVKNLFEIIKRIDGYIVSTNSKAAIVMSYCAAVIGWFTLGFERIYSNFVSPYLYWPALVFGGLLVLVSSYCLYLAVSVILPRTNSTAVDEDDDSLIFYGDISSCKKGAEGYATCISELKIEGFIRDQCRQIHAVAGIASAKFDDLKLISKWLKFCGFPLLFLLVLMICINSALRWYV